MTDHFPQVFTRAEHKRRHELNHSPEASYPCDRTGCRKAFHRQDLLQRHQERHELEAQTENAVLAHRRLPSDHTNPSSLGHPLLTSTSMRSPPILPAQAASNGLSIPSLLHPSSGEGHAHGQHSSGFEFVPRTPFPMYSSSMGSSDDFIYSSPESSSHSPLSDQYAFPHRSSISSSSSSVVDFVPPHCTSPLIHNAAASGWAPLLPPNSLPNSCATLDDEMAGFPSVSSQIMFKNRFFHPRAEANLKPVAGTSIPVPLAQLAGPERSALRQRQLAPATGSVQGTDNGGLEMSSLVEDRAWQADCLERYWRHFHPFFPIVHRPTFDSSKASSTSSSSSSTFSTSSTATSTTAAAVPPVMAGSDALRTAMIAIGSQYDTRIMAKETSLGLLEICTATLAKVIHSISFSLSSKPIFLTQNSYLLLPSCSIRRLSIHVSSWIDLIPHLPERVLNPINS